MLPVVRAYATDTGAGVLLVEQHVELALDVAVRGVVMSHGEVVLERPAHELRGDRRLLAASHLGEAAAPSAWTHTPLNVGSDARGGTGYRRQFMAASLRGRRATRSGRPTTSAAV